MTTRVTPNGAGQPPADAQSAWSCCTDLLLTTVRTGLIVLASTRPPRLADNDCGDPFDDLFVSSNATCMRRAARHLVPPEERPRGWMIQSETNPHSRHSVVDLLRGAAANWGRGGRSPVMWKLRVVANTGGGSLPADRSVSWRFPLISSRMGLVLRSSCRWRRSPGGTAEVHARQADRVARVDVEAEFLGHLTPASVPGVSPSVSRTRNRPA